jgi:riboflavin kinase/FMN adenylyltransferase
MASYTLSLDEVSEACRNGVLTIGNFDGVHLGHQALLSALRNRAAALGGPAVAVTFDPHPLQLLRPESFQPVLTTTADRADLLQHYGADHVVILRTTHELLRLSAREFFDQVIRDRFQASSLVEGENFGFGHDREGTVQTLIDLCLSAGLEPALILKPLLCGGRPVSSSRVRTELVQGRAAEAAELLGRPFRIRGRIVRGQQRGKTLGFPTANLEQVPTLIPGDGVYAVRAMLGDHTLAGAANVGPNPTFREQSRKVEIHLLDFTGDLYGRELAVDFIERLRDTRPFAGPDQLRAQLRTDVEQARQCLGRAPENQR